MENLHEYDFLYSPGTDFLLMWGAHMLERPEMTEEAEILSDTLGTWDKSDLLKDIAQTYALVLQEKENAKTFFASHPFLPCHFADALWNDAAEMLRAFDHVLYLWLAADEIFKDEASVLTADLEKAYEDICEWTDHSENFTCLRFVPLNEMRQSRLESIPEKSHYLYPWYADLSGISADTLDLIAEHWNTVRVRGYEGLSFLPENDRPLVWDCLKNDKGLLAELDARVYADKIILETIENSVSLRLFQIAKDYALKTDIPDKIAKAGLAKTACAVLTGKDCFKASPEDVGKKLENELTIDNSLGRILLTAFCGPYLSDRQRLQAFKWAESRINEKKYTRSDAYRIFEQIGQWRDKEINDRELAKVMIFAWDKLAYAVIEPAEKSVSIFQVAMDGAKNIILTSLGLARLIANKANCFPKEEKAMSGEQTKTLPEAVSLLFDDSNIVTVYTDIHVDNLNILEKKEGNERLTSLIQDMTGLPRFYMMGWGRIGENKVDIIPKTKRYTKIPVTIDLPVKNSDALVFALSSSRKIMKKVEAKEELSESELPEIKLLIYLPEEKS